MNIKFNGFKHFLITIPQEAFLGRSSTGNSTVKHSTATMEEHSEEVKTALLSTLLHPAQQQITSSPPQVSLKGTS